MSDRAAAGHTPAWRYLYYVGVTLAILTVLAGTGMAALWLASFFLYASARINPFHAGLHAWLDAALAWYDGRLPKEGRRLAGSALFGLLLAFGAPALGVYTLWASAGQRRLYGSARFADDAEIRRAGLL
ncbi:hypothetical protein CY652_13900 [Burkholderia sp. WAC0059]|uniref:hypothetical protein n=1 Tax=Burkholderia sp. WAC0059 TaxID=2066022 RepID=UPI000C7EF217|nr:hypothetical protein [Burkholderia sp. WAC0059]PLZ01877.1 hypothetical protein CY652_13900 [Burkholderia sp. WAC0059]